MISIFNLNIMHGRNRQSAIFPPKLNKKEVQSNLQKIVDCIHEYQPDLITLQEIDESSMLSGSFNHCDWLDSRLKYPYKYFAPSCSIKFLGKNIFVSGNAIFSRHPLENWESHNFAISFPTDRMGFVIADAKLPDGKTITIASVHLVYLDWIKKDSRQHQLKLLEKVLASRKNSIVVAGDFNCEYSGAEASLRSFVKHLNLQVYQPNTEKFATHPSWEPAQRIDWILGSKNAKFIAYNTLATQLSDHAPIFATLDL